MKSGEGAASLRSAVAADGAELARLVRARCAHHGEPTAFVDGAWLAEACCGPEAQLQALVITRATPGPQGRALGGLCLFHVAFEAVYSARGAYVAELFVDPDLRRQGYGRALLAAAARRARADGGSYLWWTTASENHAARAFYGEIADVLNDQAVFFAVTREAFERLCAAP